MMQGLFLIDKPIGVTSFDVVRVCKRVAKTRRVGHSGTLDPLATGLLVVCIGKGTKLVPYLMDGQKRYHAQIKLGAQTNTDDSEGEVVETASIPNLTAEDITSALKRFIGEIEQVPPVFCALKQNGESVYKKARRGESVALAARKIMIFDISLVSFNDNTIELDILCGKGTYIRSIARDLGIALKTRAHLSGLRRTETSGFNVQAAITLEELKKMENAVGGELEKSLIPLGEALKQYAAVLVTDEQKKEISFGRAIKVEDGCNVIDGEVVSLVDRDHALIAIAAKKTDKYVLKRVFV